MTTLPIADRWFELKRVSDEITLLWEPHVVPLMRCNIWHVRGRDRDLMIDTGMGIASLQDAARHLLQKDVTAVATHTHSDHVGGHHEFEHTLVHELEAENLRSPREPGTLLASVLGDEAIRRYRKAGYPFDGDLITALPSADYSMSDYRVRAATGTEIVKEGNIADLGNRHFEVLHLPGHSPGSIALWEAATGRPLAILRGHTGPVGPGSRRGTAGGGARAPRKPASSSGGRSPARGQSTGRPWPAARASTTIPRPRRSARSVTGRSSSTRAGSQSGGV